MAQVSHTSDQRAARGVLQTRERVSRKADKRGSIPCDKDRGQSEPIQLLPDLIGHFQTNIETNRVHWQRGGRKRTHSGMPSRFRSSYTQYFMSAPTIWAALGIEHQGFGGYLSWCDRRVYSDNLSSLQSKVIWESAIWWHEKRFPHLQPLVKGGSTSLGEKASK